MYELVIVWASGETETFPIYKTECSAFEAGRGMETALGEQISWWCVRKVF